MKRGRLGAFILKGAVSVGLALSAALAAIVADAASATEAALSQAHAGALVSSRETQLQLLRRAGATLTYAWSRPLDWHAGAQEAMSWISAQQSVLEPSPVHLAASAKFAERAVRASPMQGMAWMRLAGLSLRGVPVRACAPSKCLSNSQRAMPMLPADEACSRLQLWRLSGADFSADDARIAAFLRAGPTPDEIRTCLDFLSARDLYQALLRART